MTHHTGWLLSDVQHSKDSAPSWMSAPIAFNAVSDGWLSERLDNSIHSDTQPVVETANHHTAIRMPAFSDDFYNRILIEPGILDLGNLISDQVRTISVFNGYFSTRTLNDLLISSGEGLSIAGPVPPTNWGPLQTRTYDLTILTDGPATIAALISFDWDLGTADDYILPVSGVRIVSLPFQAQAPYNETLEWKTNVLESNDGSEQRIRIRKAPRQSFAGTYPVPPNQSAKAQNLLYGWISRQWAIPVWSEAQNIGAVSSGAVSLAAVTDFSDYRDGALVMLWDSAEINEAIEISTVGLGVINLSRGVFNSYANATILPVRTGRMLGSVGRNTNGSQSVLTVQLSAQDNIDLAPAAPAEQYLTYDLYWSEQLLGDGGSIDDNLIRRVDIVDFSIGKLDFFSPWLHTRVGRPYNFVLNGPEEAWNFRKFLHRRAGRLRPFWIPSFEQDLRLDATGFVSSSLRIFDDGYRVLSGDRDHIAIQYDDGTWRARAVTGVSVDDAQHSNVGIDSPLSVDASRITMICFLGLKRFDTDRIEIQWVGNGVAQSTIRMIEIKP